MTRARRCLIVAALVATIAPAQDPPRELGLEESASVRLAQIDVTVSGPPDKIRGLTAADFRLRVRGKNIDSFVVDELCQEPSALPAAPEGTVASDAHAPRPATTTYLLYFDMPHLTMMGRHTSIALAREMLPTLLTGGNRAMIVAAARELRTVAPMTGDLAALDASLAAMVNDLQDFDPYAMQEDLRVDEVLREDDESRRRSLALLFAQEERERQERDLSRLRITLGRIAELDAPKAVLYFADTMRQNPGEFYLGVINVARSSPDAAGILLAADTGPLVLDRVLREASANGIRLYTIEGQGMTAASMVVASSGKPRRDAQNTLVGMAAETGGRAFLNGGGTPAKIARQIAADLSCVYLLSFDPKSFAEDTPLAIEVDILRPGVKATARGQLVIASKASRLMTRLLAAYGSRDAATAPSGAMRVGVVPVGYDKGRFTGRVQVAVASSGVPATSWDIGASLVASGRVAKAGSGRITISEGGVPAIWEQDMRFPPGSFDVVAVSHDVTADDILSSTLRGTWPKLEARPASFGPIAVTQQAEGGFLRNGASATSGAIIVGEEDPLAPEVATAIVSLVCRAKAQKKPITVVRTLIGEAQLPVGTTELAMGSDERCAQILDLIPPKTLGPGSYRYVIAASSEGVDLATAERTLRVPE